MGHDPKPPQQGDLILKKDIYGEFIEYEFLRMSEEGYTCRAKRLSDDREEWINIKQIHLTGRRVEREENHIPADGEKKRQWTLGVDPIPEEHIQRRKRK
jgi:hypothetical protein